VKKAIFEAYDRVFTDDENDVYIPVLFLVDDQNRLIDVFLYNLWYKAEDYPGYNDIAFGKLIHTQKIFFLERVWAQLQSFIKSVKPTSETGTIIHLPHDEVESVFSYMGTDPTYPLLVVQLTADNKYTFADIEYIYHYHVCEYLSDFVPEQRITLLYSPTFVNKYTVSKIGTWKNFTLDVSIKRPKTTTDTIVVDTNDIAAIAAANAYNQSRDAIFHAYHYVFTTHRNPIPVLFLISAKKQLIDVFVYNFKYSGPIMYGDQAYLWSQERVPHSSVNNLRPFGKLVHRDVRQLLSSDPNKAMMRFEMSRKPSPETEKLYGLVFDNELFNIYFGNVFIDDNYPQLVVKLSEGGEYTLEDIEYIYNFNVCKKFNDVGYRKGSTYTTITALHVPFKIFKNVQMVQKIGLW
jgi:hypothetical protein